MMFSWAFTSSQLEAVGTAFYSINKKPIASGSIAQVYKAVLKDNKTTVAVKVRHPNVEKLIELDFRLMALIAVVVDYFLPWIRFIIIIC